MLSNLFELRRLTVMTLIASLAGFASQADAETLRWQFQAGEAYQQEMVQDMKTTVMIGGQTINTTVSQRMEATWTVGAVNDSGVAKITQNINRIRMKMSGAGGISADIDTDSDEKPQGFGAMIAAPLKAMTESEFVLTMSPRGEVLDVEVSEETVKALQNLPGAQQLGGMFTKEGLINMVKQGSPSLPEKAVQPGDSWSNKMETKLPQLGTMSTENQMTYRGTEQVDGKTMQLIELTVSTAMKSSDNPLVTMKIKEQKAEGTMYFDNQAGHLTKTSLNQNMVMELTAAGNTFDQNIDQKIEVTMKRVQ